MNEAIFSRIRRIFRDHGFSGLMHRLYIVAKKEVTVKKAGIKAVFTDFNVKKIPENSIIFFSFTAYDASGGGQRPAQLANSFIKMGRSVAYYYMMAESGNKIKKEGLIAHKNIKRVKIKDFRPKNGTILIIEHPEREFLPYVKKAKRLGCRVIYEHMDNWENSWGEELEERKKVLSKILAASDLVTFTAKLLLEKIKPALKKLKLPIEVLYSPNAANVDVFLEQKVSNKKPIDMVVGKKTAIYYGDLSTSWFDYELLEKFANYEGLEINIIGNDSSIATMKRDLAKNIHFLGPKQPNCQHT